MSNFWKKMWLAPLVGTLALGASGCSSTTEEANTIPVEVKSNIETTMSAVLGITGDEEFMESVSNLSLGETSSLAKHKDQVDSMLGLVADDSVTKEFNNEVSENLKSEDKEFVSIMSKATPFMSTFYTYNMGENEKVVVEVDDSGFTQNANGSWIPSKNGAIAFKDGENRYLAFAGTQDNLSFSSDGNKITLDSLLEQYKELEKEQTPARMSLGNMLDHLSEWTSENSDVDGMADAELSDKKNDIFSKSDIPDNATFDLKGTMNAGFTLTLTDEKTNETLTYYSLTGETSSSLDAPKKEENPEGTEAFNLYSEYLEEFHNSAEQNEEYASLDQMPELLKNNDTNQDFSWSILGDEGNKTIVAKRFGKEYKFTDITSMYESNQEDLTGEVDQEMDIPVDSFE